MKLTWTMRIKATAIALMMGMTMAKPALAQAAPHVVTSQSDATFVIGLDAPNGFMTDQTVLELGAALRSAEENPDVRVVVLTGAKSDMFMKHYDIGSLVALNEAAASAPAPAPTEGAEIELHPLHQTLLFMETMRKPVIAAINSSTAGAGMETAMAADFRILDDTAIIGQPEVLTGFIPGGGGTQRLPRLVGEARAKDIIMRGRMISAQKALNIGLVTQIVPQKDVKPTAMALAAELSSISPVSLAVVKRVVLAGPRMPHEDALKFEQQGMLQVIASEEMRDAMRAFAANPIDIFARD